MNKPTEILDFSSWSWYAGRRCLSSSRKQLSSSAVPGYHRTCPSLVLVLATCPTSEYHAVGSVAFMFCSLDVCVTQAGLRLTNLELAVHVGIKSVVPSSQPEQNNLLWSVQFVEVV